MAGDGAMPQLCSVAGPALMPFTLASILRQSQSLWLVFACKVVPFSMFGLHLCTQGGVSHNVLSLVLHTR